jgi:hypothetical protein
VKVLDHYRQAAEDFTGLASAAARTLALSGIAIIWIFKQDGENGPQLPPELLVPAMWLVISLSIDLLQYVTGAVVWTFFHRHHELRGRKPEDKVPASPFWPWTLNTLFGLKVIAVGVAYFYLLKFLWKLFQAG